MPRLSPTVETRSTDCRRQARCLSDRYVQGLTALRPAPSGCHRRRPETKQRHHRSHDVRSRTPVWDFPDNRMGLPESGNPSGTAVPGSRRPSCGARSRKVPEFSSNPGAHARPVRSFASGAPMTKSAGCSVIVHAAKSSAKVTAGAQVRIDVATRAASIFRMGLMIARIVTERDAETPRWCCRRFSVVLSFPGPSAAPESRVPDRRRRWRRAETRSYSQPRPAAIPRRSWRRRRSE